MKCAMLGCLAIGLAFTSAPVSAQYPTRVVYVSETEHGDVFEKQVASAVKSRVSATTRYALGEAHIAELELAIVCMDITTVTTNVQGDVCTYIIHYWPNELTGLSCALGAPVVLPQLELERTFFR
jgi:hypothetical protein